MTLTIGEAKAEVPGPVAAEAAAPPGRAVPGPAAKAPEAPIEPAKAPIPGPAAGVPTQEALKTLENIPNVMQGQIYSIAVAPDGGLKIEFAAPSKPEGAPYETPQETALGAPTAAPAAEAAPVQPKAEIAPPAKAGEVQAPQEAFPEKLAVGSEVALPTPPEEAPQLSVPAEARLDAGKKPEDAERAGALALDDKTETPIGDLVREETTDIPEAEKEQAGGRLKGHSANLLIVARSPLLPKKSAK